MFRHTRILILRMCKQVRNGLRELGRCREKTRNSVGTPGRAAISLQAKTMQRCSSWRIDVQEFKTRASFRVRRKSSFVCLVVRIIVSCMVESNKIRLSLDWNAMIRPSPPATPAATSIAYYSMNTDEMRVK